MTKECFAEVKIEGKLITIAVYESRINEYGRLYYSRVNGIQSKQRKRIKDWAVDMPIPVQIAIRNALERM